jgi:Zn/Cd-binding protein ZinT
MKIISVRKSPEYKKRAISYFQSYWPEVYPVLYKNSIEHSIGADQSLPQ